MDQMTCPRCGWYNSLFPFGNNGDHLVMVYGPTHITQTSDDKTNSIVFKAEQNVEFKWCSEIWVNKEA